MLRVNEYAAIVARFFAIKDRRGVTAIEYGLIASLIAVAIIAGVRLVGTNLSAVFNSVAGQISSGS
ncbi:Flp family type IVb pilin [Acetobacter lambici]|uniref:Flp family type IVb pilin n=1 Tax=Acetobacter lambici TaxID=1332824 RepID=A0ABT1F1T9_9PROT|nr:Flp family type IVb pilin [Acetobacter lambici]MCP1243102.1 Flp family type IVb pilin [Acetobacter lambici]MCP1259180.1 Flp family type IVb pilin [Acetobacter lambici]NHO56107.1 Flp family type IVb pilin [Acetobacter lambici]